MQSAQWCFQGQFFRSDTSCFCLLGGGIYQQRCENGTLSRFTHLWEQKSGSTACHAHRSSQILMPAPLFKVMTFSEAFCDSLQVHLHGIMPQKPQCDFGGPIFSDDPSAPQRQPSQEAKDMASVPVECRICKEQKALQSLLRRKRSPVFICLGPRCNRFALISARCREGITSANARWGRPSSAFNGIDPRLEIRFSDAHYGMSNLPIQRRRW